MHLSVVNGKRECIFERTDTFLSGNSALYETPGLEFILVACNVDLVVFDKVNTEFDIKVPQVARSII